VNTERTDDEPSCLPSNVAASASVFEPFCLPSNAAVSAPVIKPSCVPSNAVTSVPVVEPPDHEGELNYINKYLEQYVCSLQLPPFS